MNSGLLKIVSVVDVTLYMIFSSPYVHTVSVGWSVFAIVI